VRHFDEIEALLYALDPRFKSIHPTLNADDTFLDRRDAHLQVANIIRETIDLLVDPAEVDQVNVIRLVGHRPYSAACMTGAG
jgi:hypothetical protein